jgi:hypothetical protein
MAEKAEKKPRRRPRQKRTYIHRPNAICVTVHSQDGSAIPNSVRNEIAESVTDIALAHGLLINLADT